MLRGVSMHKNKMGLQIAFMSKFSAADTTLKLWFYPAFEPQVPYHVIFVFVRCVTANTLKATSFISDEGGVSENCRNYLTTFFKPISYIELIYEP